MPRTTPEEFLETHGHKHPETDSSCPGLCQHWYDDEELYSNLPPGPRKDALEKQIVALGRQIKQLGCKCRPLQ